MCHPKQIIGDHTIQSSPYLSLLGGNWSSYSTYCKHILATARFLIFRGFRGACLWQKRIPKKPKSFWQKNQKKTLTKGSNHLHKAAHKQVSLVNSLCIECHKIMSELKKKMHSLVSCVGSHSFIMRHAKNCSRSFFIPFIWRDFLTILFWQVIGTFRSDLIRGGRTSSCDSRLIFS